MTDTNPSVSVAPTTVLYNIDILGQIITYLHIGERCCLVRSLEDAYHRVSQTMDEHRCGQHMADLFSCILVSKLWASITIPHLWGHYAELHHILSIVHDVPAGSLRYINDYDEVLNSSWLLL